MKYHKTRSTMLIIIFSIYSGTQSFIAFYTVVTYKIHTTGHLYKLYKLQKPFPNSSDHTFRLAIYYISVSNLINYVH